MFLTGFSILKKILVKIEVSTDDIELGEYQEDSFSSMESGGPSSLSG